MSRELHEETENYTIEWDDDIEAVVHTWTGFTTGEEFRDGAEALLDVIEEKGASKLLLDTQNVKAHEDEDKEWLAEEWTPRIIEAGVQYSAQVHPDSVISKMEMENLGEEMDDIPYDHFLTSDVDEAREWLADK